MCLNYFSVSVIKVLLQKQPKKAEFILAHGSRLLSLRIHSGGNVVTLHSESGSREMKTRTLAHFLLYTVQGPSPGNGAALVGSCHLNQIKTILYTNAQRSVSLVILSFFQVLLETHLDVLR